MGLPVQSIGFSPLRFLSLIGRGKRCPLNRATPAGCCLAGFLNNGGAAKVRSLTRTAPPKETRRGIGAPDPA